MSNYLISPLGDILLAVTMSMVMGFVLRPYVINLVTKISELANTIEIKKFFSVKELKEKLFKFLLNDLGYKYSLRANTYFFVYGNSKVYSDYSNDIIIDTHYGRICLDFKSIDEIRKNINKAVTKAKKTA